MNMKIVILFISFLISSSYSQECASDLERVDCHPEEGGTDAEKQATCLDRNCIWCPSSNQGPPPCYLKEDYGYFMDGEPQTTPDGIRVNLRRNVESGSYFGALSPDAERLVAFFDFQSDYRLRIKITNEEEERFEVPIPINPPTGNGDRRLYEIVFSSPDKPFAFQVVRNSTGTVLFDTSLGGLTFSDQFIQFTTKIPSSNAYGIGENEQTTLRHDFTKYHVFPLWARDNAPDHHTNIYGVHPYYVVVEEDGNAHSVMVVNSNAQEFVLIPNPGYIYRTIGGILDLYIYLGPTPEDCARQFSEAVGRQHIPPYWGLGFQLSRWGYDHIDNLKAAVNRTAHYGIPHDIQYGDIDYMDRKLSFTIDHKNFTGLNDYVGELHEKGMHFIPIIDAFIGMEEPEGSYEALDKGTEMDVWVKHTNGSYVVGDVWPGFVYYPDYSKQACKDWWTEQIVKFKQILDFDAIWLDMNEPANWRNRLPQCFDSKYKNPPYLPHIRNSMEDNTICPDEIQEYGRHYDTHSLYGWSSSIATFEGMREALENKRGVVMTRSSFLGTGPYAGHWLGDNWSLWSNLHFSIIGLLQFNLWGMPYAGSDICGFIHAAEAQMCQRWMELGAFYPFARNHNIRDQPDQDPGFWGDEIAISSKNALLIRYELLPYLYSLFYIHRMRGDTVVRPLWHEYPTDQTALGIDKQFLWGPAVLVSPALEENQTVVNAYFPNSRWYRFPTGEEFAQGAQDLPTPLDTINVHVRGGFIIPTQEPAVNTEISKNNPFALIIALDADRYATGVLFYDDGDSIDPQDSGLYYEAEFEYRMTYTKVEIGLLTGTVKNNGFIGMGEKKFGKLVLYGFGDHLQYVKKRNSDEFIIPTKIQNHYEVNLSNMTMTSNFQLDFVFDPPNSETSTTELHTTDSFTSEATTEQTTPDSDSSPRVQFSILTLILSFVFFAN